MAAAMGREGKAACSSDVDVLLHPELLSLEFMQLILSEKNVCTRDCESRDRLTELFLRHVMPLPQRALPESRWGRRVEKSRGSAAGQKSHSSSNNHNRKRPLIVFDGSTSHSGPLKVKKQEGATTSAGIPDRLKPPPASDVSNPVRRLSGNASSLSIHRTTDMANLKREANSSDALNSPELKKKIQHVTWP